MRKLFILGVLLLAVTVLGPSQGEAFNPGAHIYIAEKVFPCTFDKINLYYGSIAPDLVLYANVDLGELENLFVATHYEYIDLRSSAWSFTQKAFAKGWLTHNEKWGADKFAHIYFDGFAPGYVYQKAESLRGIIEPLITPLKIDWDPWGREFAHDVIEVVIDLLLKQQDHKLGGKILEAALFRSWEDRNLLTRVLVLRERVTDWVTLASAEVAFRNILVQYAIALSLSTHTYMDPLAELGRELAYKMYGIDLMQEDALALLDEAVKLCQDDYLVPIGDAIQAFP